MKKALLNKIFPVILLSFILFLGVNLHNSYLTAPWKSNRWEEQSLPLLKNLVWVKGSGTGNADAQLFIWSKNLSNNSKLLINQLWAGESNVPAPALDFIAPVTEEASVPLVKLKEIIPTLEIDLRYASDRNFTGKKLYQDETAYLRRETAAKLKMAQEEALNRGYSLKIWDAYRHPEAQFTMWEAYPDPNFVANPHTGFSDHSRGIAVDVTLVDRQGNELVMPSAFDAFGAKADRDYRDVGSAEAANARILEEIMTKSGFWGLSSEWWHFADTQRFDVIYFSGQRDPSGHRQTVITEMGNKEAGTELLISAIGDNTLGQDPGFPYQGSFDWVYEQKKNPAFFFSGVKHILQQDDLTIANLEGVLTNHNKKPDKSHQNEPFFFKGQPAYAQILKEGSVEAVNLANNHTLDYMEEGFAETVKHLKNAGIAAFGRGSKQVLTVKGVKVALLGYNLLGDLEEGVEIEPFKKQVQKDIKEANQQASLVIVSFHWGDEGSAAPNALQQEIGRMAVDNGADLVLGHHPHIVQKIEEYRGKFIVYSLANFVFGGHSNPWDRDTIIFQQKFKFDQAGRYVESPQAVVIPCQVSALTRGNDYRPVVAAGPEAERIKGRILSP